MGTSSRHQSSKNCIKICFRASHVDDKLCIIQCFWRYGDLDLLKAIGRNVTGHLIRTSLGRFQDLGICNMTDMPTINTRDCGNASSLMIKTTLWSVYVELQDQWNGPYFFS